ncbi:MAG: hypothetical protein HKN44_13970 [Ilumatobacter sp.]|nr:hypothetical protein [Ilumatobacter sp.]
MATTLTEPTDRSRRAVGRRRIPVVPPSIRDPRLHVSAVILTTHLLGQLWLNFHISVVQIVLTLATCALLDLAVVFLRSGAIVWPGSGLLTGGGISLVLRVPGTDNGDYWSFHGWYWFVGVGAFGMATKYLIRYRGSHVFNPSNVALVAAFVVFGSERIEPLDLWWAPFGWEMLLAYLVILVGGFTIGRRLDLTPMALAFWATLAVGMGLLVASGHSITARWSFTPIEGMHFWWIVVTSPEVLIFLFFMITDPRTVPQGKVARIAFAVAVGVLCTLLIAPQTTEFGAKVALLGGLVIVCVARPWFDAVFPARNTDADDVAAYTRRVLAPDGTRRVASRGALAVGVVAAWAVAVAVAGLPARSTAATDRTVNPVEFVAVDVAALPEITVDRKVRDFARGLETPEGARELAETLADNLAVEGEAILTGNVELLAGVDHGDRLEEYEQVVADASTSITRTVSTYEFDSLHLTVVFPQGAQSGANAGFVATGAVTQLTYGPQGTIIGEVTEPLATTFTMRPVNGGRWLTTDTID